MRVPYLGKVFYPGYEQTLTLIDETGRRHVVPPRDVPTDSANFTVVQDAMEQREMIRQVRIGDARSLLFKASDALGVAIELLRADRAALLCSNERCPVCPAARKLCVSQF